MSEFGDSLRVASGFSGERRVTKLQFRLVLLALGTVIRAISSSL
jgi:hypothetical protein